MYFMAGHKEGAQKMWENAVQLNKNEKMAHGNLGLIYMQQGQFENAEKELLMEIEINRNF